MARRSAPPWKRSKGGPSVRLSGRDARKIGRQVTKASQPRQGGKAVNQALAESGLRRARPQFVPFYWLAALLGTGLIIHLTPYPPLIASIFAIVTSFSLWGFTSHLSVYARNAARVAAILDLAFLPLLAVYGPQRIVLAALLAVWAVCAGLWLRHHHWHLKPEDTSPAPAFDDYKTWARLADKRRWSGALTDFQKIPGGRRYKIVLDGAETDIGEVMAQPRKIAAAWGKSMTEAYVEPTPQAIESEGYLNILNRDTLEKVRLWDGASINRDTGHAAIGVFADGQRAHIQYFARRSGVSHMIVAGCTDSGKSYTLNLVTCIGAMSGLIIPVILDPQEGQSLPAWRKHVQYASGADECMALLRALHAGMLDRSRLLSDKQWRDEDGDEHDGMDFFDPFMTGLPIIQVTIDEAPALLNDRKHGNEAVELVGDIAKRGRKAGVQLILAAQVPSLAELGTQALRSMLVSCNVICLRTGDKVSGGMVNLQTDPSLLKRFFADGSKTYGLGYVIGPDNRQAPMRTFLEPKPARVAAKAPIPKMDERFAAVLDRTMALGGVQRQRADAGRQQITGQPAAEPGPEEPKARDAVWQVLTDDGGELFQGEIAKRAAVLVKEQWKRPQGAYRLSSIQKALGELEAGIDGRRITRDGKMYRAVKEG